MSDDDPFEGMPSVAAAPPGLPGSLELGAFSVSLAVADLDASRAFYTALGFEVTGGDPDEGWLILKNGESTLGLFHGMFERNLLTFNPGLTPRMERLDRFTDVREVERRVREAGIEPTTGVDPDSTDPDSTDPDSSGPGSMTLVDPDGNQILIDQFF